MIVGDKGIFAIESNTSLPDKNPSIRGVGNFMVHIRSKQYGQTSTDATSLACSFDEVARRFAERGKHLAPFSRTRAPEQLALAIRKALYEENADIINFFGLSIVDFSKLVYLNRILWAPDGDAAFDDGSYILQFDIGENVRLIAFKSTKGYGCDPGTLSDLTINADIFYSTLRTWHTNFEKEWSHAIL